MRRAIAICSAVLAISVLPASAAFASTATLSDSPPPGAVTIDLVNANGSGCPVGSAVIALQPDKTAFTISYSKYTAAIGAGTGTTDFRKNCQIGARLHVPQGFTFALASADYRGFAAMKPGVSAVEGANYYFTGAPQTIVKQHPVAGPLQNPWVTHDVIPFASLEFAPCGGKRDLNINTSLLLQGAGPAGTTSTITMDSTDLSLDTIIHLAWKQCKI